jgi:hypothetical protein
MREKIFAMLLIALMVSLQFGWISPAHAQPVPQERLATCRAAQRDAYRQLAKRINDLRVESNTYVRDFTGESDEISTAFDAFVKGARVVDTRQLDDGSCEVTVEVNIQQLEEELKRIAKEHYHGDKWHEHTFDNIHTYSLQKVLTITGIGVAGPTEPEWASQSIRATGSGVPPENVKDPNQARSLAEREAEADAKRNLLKQIWAIQVDSETHVRDYAAQHDELTTRLNAFLADSKKLDTRYLDDGMVEVDMEAPLSGVWDILKSYRKR